MTTVNNNNNNNDNNHLLAKQQQQQQQQNDSLSSSSSPSSSLLLPPPSSLSLSNLLHSSTSSSSSSSSVFQRKEHCVSIVVVAKCPLVGKSKTRLIPLLGENGSVEFATAMLADTLQCISDCKELDHVDKILLYAPPNKNGKDGMIFIMKQFHIPVTSFTLIPMHMHTTTTTMSDDGSSSSSSSREENYQSNNHQHNNNNNNNHPEHHQDHDMTSTDLGTILQNGLIVARERQMQAAIDPNNDISYGHVIFLGMDSPEVPMDELISICSSYNRSSSSNSNILIDDTRRSSAILLPADDGGYGLLAVPWNADPYRTFCCGIRWSNPLTALCQIKAFTDQYIPVFIGPVMHDIDTPEDVQNLCQRLKKQQFPIHTSSSTTTFSSIEEVNKDDDTIERKEYRSNTIDVLHIPSYFTHKRILDTIDSHCYKVIDNNDTKNNNPICLRLCQHTKNTLIKLCWLEMK